MECPHCHEEIPGTACPDCGAMIPVESRYCMDCGAYVEVQEQDTYSEEDGLDFDNRILCPDGTCTGIIIDGKCSECGKREKGK